MDTKDIDTKDVKIYDILTQLTKDNKISWYIKSGKDVVFCTRINNVLVDVSCWNSKYVEVNLADLSNTTVHSIVFNNMDYQEEEDSELINAIEKQIKDSNDSKQEYFLNILNDLLLN